MPEVAPMTAKMLDLAGAGGLWTFIKRPSVNRLLQRYKEHRENGYGLGQDSDGIDLPHTDPKHILHIAEDSVIRSILLTSTDLKPSLQIPREILRLAINLQLIFELILTAPDVFKHSKGLNFHDWDVYRAYVFVGSVWKMERDVAGGAGPGAAAVTDIEQPDSAVVLVEFTNGLSNLQFHELNDTDAISNANSASPLPYTEAAAQLGLNLLNPTLVPIDSALFSSDSTLSQPPLVLCKTEDSMYRWVDQFRMLFQLALTLKIFHGKQAQIGDPIWKPLVLDEQELEPFLNDLDATKPATGRVVILAKYDTWAIRTVHRARHSNNESGKRGVARNGLLVLDQETGMVRKYRRYSPRPISLPQCLSCTFAETILGPRRQEARASTDA
jgi:hypothetical protein